jgi:hypothetical protein
VSGVEDIVLPEGDEVTWVKWHGKSQSKALAQAETTAKLQDPVIRAAFDILIEAGMTADQYGAELAKAGV